MSTSTIKYLGNLRTELTHTKSSEKVVTDAPTDNNGKGAYFSPTDLVATALGSCMLTVMGIKANEMGIPFEGAKVEIQKTMESNPRRISQIDVTLNIPIQGLSDKEIKILENTGNTCPVAKSLHSDLIQNIKFNWI